MGKKKLSDDVDPPGWNLRGVSRHIRELRAEIQDSAKTHSTVLIQGPTGTGKELVAKDIHAHSPRKDKPFVTVNCGAIPENLLESELFGHVRGAFTGADREKRGQVEIAHGGTLFLDEVGDLRGDHQVKLLRFLENKSYRPVGADKEKSVDVRVVAATNKDLRGEIKNNRFREDLYYRLSQTILKTAPLKDRPEDIVYFLNHFSTLEKIKIDAKIKILLYSYYYPGNVRELKNYLNKDKNQIINEWIDVLAEQGFYRKDIAEIDSYLDFCKLERKAYGFLYERKLIFDGEARTLESLPSWADKILFDLDIRQLIEAISFVQGSKDDDLDKIVKSYEILTLFQSGMPKTNIIELLRIRKEKLHRNFFTEYYGLPWPKDDDSSEKRPLKFWEFPLYQKKINRLQQLVLKAQVSRP
jgi:DNA-binding NtrC family response regulator